MVGSFGHVYVLIFLTTLPWPVDKWRLVHPVIAAELADQHSVVSR